VRTYFFAREPCLRKLRFFRPGHPRSGLTASHFLIKIISIDETPETFTNLDNFHAFETESGFILPEPRVFKTPGCNQRVHKYISTSVPDNFLLVSINFQSLQIQYLYLL